MTKNEHEQFFQAQERADELRRRIESVCKQAADEATAGKFAAQKRKPRKYNSSIGQAEKLLRRLVKECKAARMKWEKETE